MSGAPPGDIPDPGARPRYGTRAFPAYRFVPGVQPHPTRDPRGHSYATGGTPRRGAWTPDQWRTLDDWLEGVDLFNAHYFWEAHEAWEGLWAAQPRDSIPALFLQGLIQIAAALLKTHMRAAAGAQLLAGEGLAKLRRVAAEKRSMMGLDLEPTIAAFEAFFALDAPSVAQAPVLRLP